MGDAASKYTDQERLPGEGGPQTRLLKIGDIWTWDKLE